MLILCDTRRLSRSFFVCVCVCLVQICSMGAWFIFSMRNACASFSLSLRFYHSLPLSVSLLSIQTARARYARSVYIFFYSPFSTSPITYNVHLHWTTIIYMSEIHHRHSQCVELLTKRNNQAFELAWSSQCVRRHTHKEEEGAKGKKNCRNKEKRNCCIHTYQAMKKEISLYKSQRNGWYR